MSKRRSFILDPIPVPQSSPEIARPSSRGAGHSNCRLPVITPAVRPKRPASSLTNGTRTAYDRMPDILITSRDGPEAATPVKPRGASNPFYSQSHAPLSLRRRVARDSPDVDLLVTSPSASVIEMDPGLQPESISAISGPMKESQNDDAPDASAFETAPGIPILDQVSGVISAPFENESTNSTEVCNDNDGNNVDEPKKYSVQQVRCGPTENDAGYVSRRVCYLSTEKTALKDDNISSIEQILAASATERRAAVAIESYFTKQITPPIYKTHRPAERKVKPLTPQPILNKDGMAVESSKQEEHGAKIPEKQILIRTSPPFKRLIQTPYGDFITKFEYPSFNVTRYNTLSRLRWMSYKISHFDSNLNPDQKMHPIVPNIFYFQSEIYHVLKKKLSSSETDVSRKFAFSVDELKSILDKFEGYYKEFESLPRPVIIPQEYSHEYAREYENRSIDRYGGSKAPVFDQSLFQDDKFRYNVDILGDQFGFNVIRCPAPVDELLHNEDLAIADAERTIESIQNSLPMKSTGKDERHRHDKQMAILIKEHHKIDLFNPKLITSSDTYTIMDTQCKIELSYETGYLRLDSSIAGSPLPEGSVSVSQLMRHGISIVEAERNTLTSIYKSSSVGCGSTCAF